MPTRPLEQPCPLCDDMGTAVSTDGETVFAYRCDNDECDKGHFVSSKMTFYPSHPQQTEQTDSPIPDNWDWQDVRENMT